MQFRRIKRALHGVLLLDKPLGVSSNHALLAVRHLYCAAKAGHTGTLDPLATGLLPICLGEATKFSSYLLEADKTYRARIRLGSTTSTGDAEGEVLEVRPVRVTLDDIATACARFLGEIKQVPPMYSALKHQGKALYEYARAGVEIERSARQVTIHYLDVLSYADEVLEIDVRCSKGTYIRTLAEDIGTALGCGAHLAALRRTQTGGFDIQAAYTLDALKSLTQSDLDPLLLPMDSLLQNYAKIYLQGEMSMRLMRGQSIAMDVHESSAQSLYRIYCDDKFCGVGRYQCGLLQPIRLIAHSE